VGARPLKGDEAEQILKTADLKALPTIFAAGDQGLGLVIKDGAKNVINSSAPAAKEVLDYLKNEHSYGSKDSRIGRQLERRFCGIGYGWTLDMVQLLLATLFRANEVEVTYQGNRYASYQDPASRGPFTKVSAFRSSLFSPRQSVGLKMLTQAVQQLEDLTGEEVDVEEGAIAAAFKKVAAEELEKLHPLSALAEAHHLPIVPLLADYKQTLVEIGASTSDDCARILAETGAIFGETRERVRKLREVLGPASLDTLRQARAATEQVWQRLSAHCRSPEVAESVKDLKALLTSDQFIDSFDAIAAKTRSTPTGRRILRSSTVERKPTRRPLRRSETGPNGGRWRKRTRTWPIRCSPRSALVWAPSRGRQDCGGGRHRTG
jgi:hypothetical protein